MPVSCDRGQFLLGLQLSRMHRGGGDGQLDSLVAQYWLSDFKEKG